MNFKYFKLEIFIPESSKLLEDLARALQSVDAGHVGNYDSCLSFSIVKSRWRPLEQANPWLGQTGRISYETEYKVEVLCKAGNLDSTMQAIKKVHPYETPVINVIPLYAISIAE